MWLTTHIILEPLDFIARLPALAPQPRVDLTHFHGVLAPDGRFESTAAGRAGNQSVRFNPIADFASSEASLQFPAHSSSERQLA